MEYWVQEVISGVLFCSNLADTESYRGRSSLPVRDLATQAREVCAIYEI